MSAESAMPECVCDVGYVDRRGGNRGPCVEDTACVNLSTIECRSSAAQGSAVGMLVSATYCSGNPVPNLQASDLELQEMGATDWEVPGVESSLTVRQRDYLSHVYVVVDVSASIVTSGVLPHVRAGIEALLEQLDSSSADARVAVMLFDGTTNLYEFQPETSDFEEVRERLASLESFEALDRTSTDLYGATIRGIARLDGSVTTKYAAHDGGLFATRTLVIVSDGDDDAARVSAKRAQAAIGATTARVITIGLGEEKDVGELTALGRDGSYTADGEARVVAAFTDIGQQVVRYPETLYLIGYCSPRRAGSTAARVLLTSLGATSAECAFFAGNFSGGCDQDVFDPEKACGEEGLACGGIVGCGTCGDNRGCRDGECREVEGLSAGEACGAGWMCAGGNCESEACVEAVPLAGACSEAAACEFGVTMCGAGSSACEAALAEGAECDQAKQCRSLSCGTTPGSAEPMAKTCLPRARAYERCSASVACEPGLYCAACETGLRHPGCTDGSQAVCLPVKGTSGACTENAECASGECSSYCTKATNVLWTHNW